MEHTKEPLKFTLAGRELSVLLNIRASRLYTKNAAKSNGAASGPLGPHNIFAVGLGMFENQAELLWCATQNSANGSDPKEWPTKEWIEENLETRDFDRLTALIAELMPKSDKNPPPAEALTPSTPGLSADTT